jgi:hypothetical protein
MKVKETTDPYIAGQQDLINYLKFESKAIMAIAESDKDINKLLDVYNLIQKLKPVSK